MKHLSHAANTGGELIIIHSNSNNNNYNIIVIGQRDDAASPPRCEYRRGLIIINSSALGAPVLVRMQQCYPLLVLAMY